MQIFRSRQVNNLIKEPIDRVGRDRASARCKRSTHKSFIDARQTPQLHLNYRNCLSETSRREKQHKKKTYSEKLRFEATHRGTFKVCVECCLSFYLRVSFRSPAVGSVVLVPGYLSSARELSRRVKVSAKRYSRKGIFLGTEGADK